MQIHPLWSDDYWLLLMQLYLRKPAGVKPLYSRGMVDLSLELHIPPQFLYEQMFRLRRLDTPRMKRLWEKYACNPQRLAKGAKTLRRMAGFNSSGVFYEGIDTCETFEKDFKPIDGCDGITPVILTVVLDLYFRLTPITMVVETPEIQDLARLTKVKASKIVEIMDVYQICDPYLNRDEMLVSKLLGPCQKTWQRFGNDSPEILAALAAQLKEYFR